MAALGPQSPPARGPEHRAYTRVGWDQIPWILAACGVSASSEPALASAFLQESDDVKLNPANECRTGDMVEDWSSHLPSTTRNISKRPLPEICEVGLRSWGSLQHDASPAKLWQRMVFRYQHQRMTRERGKNPSSKCIIQQHCNKGAFRTDAGASSRDRTIPLTNAAPSTGDCISTSWFPKGSRSPLCWLPVLHSTQVDRACSLPSLQRRQHVIDCGPAGVCSSLHTRASECSYHTCDVKHARTWNRYQYKHADRSSHAGDDLSQTVQICAGFSVAKLLRICPSGSGCSFRILLGSLLISVCLAPLWEISFPSLPAVVISLVKSSIRWSPKTSVPSQSWQISCAGPTEPWTLRVL